MARDITIKIGATDTASAALRKVSGNISKFGKSAGQSIRNAGSAISGVGRNITALGGAASLALAGATRTFAQFDAKMAEVGAISGAVGDELASLRDKAKEMGSTTAFSASEAAEGMKFLGMAGFDTQQILAGIGPTLSLAAAGGVELGEAADIASDVSSAFGLTANEIGRVADAIAATATSANTDVLKMGETFKFVAPVAKAAGQSLEEVSAAAGILGNAGVKASMAGTDLKNLLVAVANSGEAFKELGVETKDASGEMRPILDIMRDYGKAIDGLSGADKVSKSMSIFGKISAKSALILADAGDEVERMRDVMENADGAAARMAETMQDNLGGIGVRIKSAFEGVQIALVESFAEPLAEIGKRLASTLGQVTQWIGLNKSLVKALALGAGAVTGLGVALMTLGATLGFVGLSVSGIAAGIGTLGTIISGVGVAITAMFTPIGALVAGVTIAVAALTYAFVQAGIKTGLFSEIMDVTMGMLRQMLAVIKKTFGGISDAIAAGDWALAAKIAFTGLKVVFWDGLKGITVAWKRVWPLMWETAKKFFLSVIKLAGKSMLTLGQIIAAPGTAPVKLYELTKAITFSAYQSGGTGTGFIDRNRDQASTDLERLVDEARIARESSQGSKPEQENLAEQKQQTTELKNLIALMKDGITVNVAGNPGSPESTQLEVIK